MAKSGLRHIDVGPELTKTEWENEETHELMHGTEFPASPAERQLFYRDNEHKWYIYDGTGWVSLQGGGGMEAHGNEYHDPDFEEEGVAASLVETHRTTETHTQPQPPAEHGNEKHDPDFEQEGVAASLVETHRTTETHTQPQPPAEHGNEKHDPDFEEEGVAAAQITTHAALSTNVHGIQDVPLFSAEAKTYYIDAVSGDDGNGGESSGDAFKTWAKAETMIPVFIMHDYEVITLGNLPEDIILEGRTTISGGSLSIKGDKETTPYYTVNKIDVLSCFGDIRIQYFRTTVNRTFVGYSMLPRLDGVRFIHHDASSARAFDLEACIMGLRDCNVGTNKAQDGIFATNCRLVSHDNSGNATRYGLYANNSAVIAKRIGQPTGTTANEYTTFGGVIR